MELWIFIQFNRYVPNLAKKICTKAAIICLKKQNFKLKEISKNPRKNTQNSRKNPQNSREKLNFWVMWKRCPKKDLGCFYTLSHPFVRFRRLYLLSYAFICFHKLLYDFICFHMLLYPFQHFHIHFYTLLHAFIHFLYAFLRIQTQKSKTSPPPLRHLHHPKA